MLSSAGSFETLYDGEELEPIIEEVREIEDHV